jgi:hypothetical protein
LKYVSALPKDASFGAKAKYLVLGSVWHCDQRWQYATIHETSHPPCSGVLRMIHTAVSIVRLDSASPLGPDLSQSERPQGESEAREDLAAVEKDWDEVRDDIFRVRIRFRFRLRVRVRVTVRITVGVRVRVRVRLRPGLGLGLGLGFGLGFGFGLALGLG